MTGLPRDINQRFFHFTVSRICLLLTFLLLLYLLLLQYGKAVAILTKTKTRRIRRDGLHGPSFVRFASSSSARSDCKLCHLEDRRRRRPMYYGRSRTLWILLEIICCRMAQQGITNIFPFAEREKVRPVRCPVPCRFSINAFPVIIVKREHNLHQGNQRGRSNRLIPLQQYILRKTWPPTQFP